LFGKLFGRKTAVQSTLVVVRLNDRAQPLDRGEIYEDPLDEVLKKQGVGSVVGGGTLLSAEGEIEFCDIEIEIHEPTVENIALIRQTLEELGAPRGSTLRIEPELDELPFGNNEGLAVYLNGTDLPDDAYAQCDSNFVYSEFNRLLGSEGKVHSHWQGPTETALYAYGPSFATMQARLAGFLGSYPLCQRARVVQIA
jgi:hypothetical protein